MRRSFMAGLAGGLLVALVLVAGASAAPPPSPPPVIDPCPVMAVRLPGGHIQPLGCAVFLPEVAVQR